MNAERIRVLEIVAIEAMRDKRELRGVIRDAVPLLQVFRQLMADRVLPGHDGPILRGIDAWLERPEVISALALAEADAGR